MGSPDLWGGSWKHSLVKMKGIDPNSLTEYWTKFKTAYSEATMDFVQLQHIDYYSSFHCNCCHKGVTMDGMTLSFKKQHARIVHPWLEDAEGSIVFGSHFKDRIFVQDKHTRDLLLLFTSTGFDNQGGAQMQATKLSSQRGSSAGQPTKQY